MTDYAIIKDPQAILDYGFDWSAWLDDDAISTSTWILPSGMTSVQEGINGSTTIIWLSGGVIETRYDVVNRIVTVAGRTDDRTIKIVCMER